MMEWWALGLMVAPGATHDEPNTMLKQPYWKGYFAKAATLNW